MSRRVRAMLPVAASAGLYAVYVTGYMLGAHAGAHHRANNIGEWLIVGLPILALATISQLWQAAREPEERSQSP